MHGAEGGGIPKASRIRGWYRWEFVLTGEVPKLRASFNHCKGQGGKAGSEAWAGGGGVVTGGIEVVMLGRLAATVDMDRGVVVVGGLVAT